jgi:hypothetical protein
MKLNTASKRNESCLHKHMFCLKQQHAKNPNKALERSLTNGEHDRLQLSTLCLLLYSFPAQSACCYYKLSLLFPRTEKQHIWREFYMWKQPNYNTYLFNDI